MEEVDLRSADILTPTGVLHNPADRDQWLTLVVQRRSGQLGLVCLFQLCSKSLKILIHNLSLNVPELMQI
jgi:hypothetical protein